MARVIGVLSGKGGVGKTTLVTNISTILAQKFNKDVTVIDCNLTTSHLGMYMGIFSAPITLNNVLKGEAMLGDAIYAHSSGVKIIPASLSLTDLEGLDISNLKEIIKTFSGEGKIILLDAAPGLGREAISAMEASNEIIFVTTPFLPSITDIIRCREVAEQFGVKILGVVLNMVTNGRYELKKTEVEDLTGLPVLASVPYNKEIGTSLGLSIPIYLLNSWSETSKEFLKLSSGLIGEKITESRISRIFNKLKFW